MISTVIENKNRLLLLGAYFSMSSCQTHFIASFTSVARIGTLIFLKVTGDLDISKLEPDGVCYDPLLTVLPVSKVIKQILFD